MSSAKGNLKKSGPPKHQNKTAFSNSRHDTSKKTKMINSLTVSSCCSKCTEVIEWKIRYKKFKPLTVPKKCTKCEQKCVKQAYSMMCALCAEKLGVCAKCGKDAKAVHQPSLSAAEEAARNSQLQQELKMLPERKRRAFYRMLEKAPKEGTGVQQDESNPEENTDDHEDSSDTEGDGKDTSHVPDLPPLMKNSLTLRNEDSEIVDDQAELNSKDTPSDKMEQINSDTTDANTLDLCKS